MKDLFDTICENRMYTALESRLLKLDHYREAVKKSEVKHTKLLKMGLNEKQKDALL